MLSPEAERLPERVELSDVPFFPQQAYQCGPAALATMLTQRDVATTPGALRDKVYLPGREGSLQVEMVAAARSHDMLVYPLQPKLETLLIEVAAGNPVLVLQNLAFDWYPQWHFAVVVGYDRRARTLTLRSGTTRRLVDDFASFERSWARGQRWAVLTLPPEQLPAQADMHRWLAAASDLEQTGRVQAAQRAYRRASEAWPEQALPWFALGNRRYVAGDQQGAEQALRASVEKEPDFAAGWYNLSQLLGERGCAREARQAQACAQKLAPDDTRFAMPPADRGDGQCQALPVCP
ncbi:hypothetical protein NCCP436_27350 [Pseudomonas sp. NCCP-436]|nr:hypothetical protein NCCP436_27350 [Pseudomonas sp. NCCP-436]